MGFIWCLLVLVAVVKCEQVVRVSLSRTSGGLEESVANPLGHHMPMENHHNTQYYGRLYLGPSHQVFRILFDTGSSWFWIKDSNCDGCKGKSFDCAGSPTCNYLEGFNQTIYYGHGEVSGVGIEESVSLDAAGKVVFRHKGLILQKMKDLEGFLGDGLVGLAFASRAAGLPTFLDSLRMSGVIQHRVYSLYLSDNPESDGIADAELIIGGYDKRYFAKGSTEFDFFPLVSSFAWSIRLDGVSVGDKSIPIAAKQVLIDSGTSYLSIAEDDFDGFTDIFDKILGEDTCDFEKYPYICDCNSKTPFPVLKFHIGGQTYEILPSAYVRRQKSLCILRLGKSVNPAEPRWILGDLFMRKYYTFFDAEQRRIGFAPAKDHSRRQDHIFAYIAIVSLAVALASAGFVAVVIYRSQRRDYEQGIEDAQKTLL